MPSIVPVLASGSTNGRMTKVAATATAGTLIHTAAPPSGGFDEITLYAVNSDNVSRKLTIELGGVSTPDDLVEVTIPPESGLFLVVPPHRVNGTVAIRAFADAANVVSILADVNRYTP